MTKKIFKYPLKQLARQHVLIPYESEILHVGVQRNPLTGEEVITLWASVDPDENLVEWEFRIVGTGWDVPENGEHVGTVELADGNFIWHIYDLMY